MIARISGALAFAESNAVIIDVGGVGYRVFATSETIRLAAALPAASLSLWTHLAVRDNALELYGFVEQQELELFSLLLSVSGIGPKSALGILNLASVETLCRAIAAGDASYLTKVAGIGKKNAGKIVLELKDKLEAVQDFDGIRLPDTDALEALAALGYPLAEAREALKRVSPDIQTVEERITFALRTLGRPS